MNTSVSSNKRFRNSLIRSFRQCFVRLFPLIRCNPANVTALLTLLASPGWQHVLFWVRFCTTSFNCSPAQFSQLCCTLFRHRDSPSILPINAATSTHPTGRECCQLTPDAASFRGSNFIPPRKSHTGTSPPWQTAQCKSNFSNYILRTYPSGTQAPPALPGYFSMQEPALNPDVHTPSAQEQPQPLGSAMLSHAAWPARRSGARNHTGDEILAGAGLLREIKLEGKPQLSPTRGVSHTLQPQAAGCEEPADAGHSTGTGKPPGSPTCTQF